MAEITLFQKYHNEENQTTNYCGLILKLIYQASPQKLEEILGQLLGDRFPLLIGPRFDQQKRVGSAVPDLEIQQTAFTIRFETKLGKGHNEVQLISHIRSFEGTMGSNVLLVLNSSEDEDYNFGPNSRAEADRERIGLAQLSFDRFYSTVEEKCRGISETLDDAIYQFGDYLSLLGLRSSWQQWINVLATQHSQNEIAGNVYMCPLSRAYSFDRTKYLGTYWEKYVRSVHFIRACVIVEVNQSGTQIKWKNSDEPDNSLREEAIRAVRRFTYRVQENCVSELQVFLLDAEQAGTSVFYDFHGGMRGHRYLRIPKQFALNVSEAAKFLAEQKTFSKVESNGTE